MIVIGLTGSIGMGKSTVANQFAALGVRVCSADAIVHQLMAKNGAAVLEIGNYFSTVIKNQAVDRRALGDIVFKDKVKLKQLEQILHPLVVAAENNFICKEQCKGAWAAVLEIPLLFETGAEERCDCVAVVSAPALIQRQRVLKRAGVTPEKLSQILALQMPDQEKRQRADIVVHTGLGKSYSFHQVKMWLQQIRSVA